MIDEVAWMDFDTRGAYQFGLLPLVVWREAQNQGYDGMLAVAWTIRNRVNHPSWWGNDYPSCILHHWQYSSFNWSDVNDVKFPKGNEPSWQVALQAAVDAFTGQATDPTDGATSYYDNSIPAPSWSKTMTFTKQIGNFLFFK